MTVDRLDFSKPPPGYNLDTWYEDALKVADLLDDEDIRRVMERVDDGCPLRGDPWWPRVLAWSADQRAEVRHWLAGGAVVAGWMPEVLRG